MKIIDFFSKLKNATLKPKKYVFKIISLILMIILSVYVLGFALNRARDHEIYKEKDIETKIYSVWHIETFEGGSKPRIQLLKSVARDIEKQNNGILFMITSVSVNELENRLKDNCPDIISFGFGVGKTVLPHLCELEQEYQVRDSLTSSSTYANKLMAIPYISSGYAKFSHGGEISEWIYGKTEFTSPNLAGNEKECFGQYEAYKEFIYNKKTALIGTARDVFRVFNLNNVGRLTASITPIADYTDLIQYCGITKKDDYTILFLEKLLCAETQVKLTDYSLFSVKHNKIYSSGIYSDMEDAILSATTPNVFE